MKMIATHIIVINETNYAIFLKTKAKNKTINKHDSNFV